MSSIIFHGVEGENCQTPDSPSWFNPMEASQVFLYINDFYRLGLKADDIGIISPYVKQVIKKTLYNLLQSNSNLLNYRYNKSVQFSQKQNLKYQKLEL